MRITRATDYAVRLLAALSNASGKRLRIAELAATTTVPKDYVAKVLAPLVRRGWVLSSRGMGGGFLLAAPERQITLLDVVELFEGSLHLQPCTGPAGCQFTPRCPVHEVWLEAERALCQVLRKYTVAELAERSRQRGLFLPVVPAE